MKRFIRAFLSIILFAAFFMATACTKEPQQHSSDQPIVIPSGTAAENEVESVDTTETAGMQESEDVLSSDSEEQEELEEQLENEEFEVELEENQGVGGF